MTYHYSVYGLTVESAIELPELVKQEARQLDAQIVAGDVPETLDKPKARYSWIEYADNVCLLKADGIARFLIEDGCRITIDRRIERKRQRGCGAPAADVRLFLLGSAFGALIHQRNWIPLHVSAVVSPAGVIAFTGNSGDGKSTLAGWLHRKYDWPLLCDDVCVLKPEDSQPLLYPGPRKLKLWEDAIIKLGCQDENFVHDLSNTPKFQLYLPESNQCEPSLLKNLVVLERSDKGAEASLEPLFGASAFLACRFGLYRPYMAYWFRGQLAVMRDLTDLANRISTFRFRRPWNINEFGDQLGPIVSELACSKNKVIA